MLEISQWFNLQNLRKMNRLLILISAFIVISCNQTKDSNVFDSDKLRGKYKVDLTPIIAEAAKSNESDDEWSKMGKGLAAMALSSVKIEINFYEDNKGIMHMDGGLIDIAAAMSDEPVEKTHEFSYKVENDSILYMKNKDEDQYKKWAIVQKYSDNYDYLKFLIIEEGKDKVYFNLNKIND
jgi:hypothetical protein